MGVSWRRLSEGVRQKVGITTDKTFKATANCRNEAMFKEATDFSVHLKTMERDLRAMSKQVESQFLSLKNILSSPLPRAYDVGADGPVPLEAEVKPIGMHVNLDLITDSGQEMKRRLETEVIQPVKEWMVAYRTIQDRMKHLEIVRLEFDSRRRTVADLQGSYERMRANIGSLGTNAQAELQKLEAKTNHKHEKMQRTCAQYEDIERTVYNSLFTLVRDTSVLREYTSGAIAIIQECFTLAHTAYDGVPAIEFSTTNPTAGGFGAIASAAIGASAEIDMYRYDAQQNSDGDADVLEQGQYDQVPYGYPINGHATPACPPQLRQYSMQGPRDTACEQGDQRQRPGSKYRTNQQQGQHDNAPPGQQPRMDQEQQARPDEGY
eukprot:gene9746-7621_t